MKELFITKELYNNLSQEQKEEYAAIFNCLLDLRTKKDLSLKEAVTRVDIILPKLISFYQSSLSSYHHRLIGSFSNKPFEAIWGYVKLSYRFIRAQWLIFKLKTLHFFGKLATSAN